jgi:Nif-specific regulatory protein
MGLARMSEETSTQNGTLPLNDQREARELDALFRISQLVATVTNQRQMLGEVLDVLDRELALERGTIMLLAPEGNEVRLEVAHGIAEHEQKEIGYKLGEGIMGRVAASGRPAIIPQALSDPEFLDRIYHLRRKHKDEISFICVPISIGSEVVGTLSVHRPYVPGDDLELDARLLSIVAGTIGNDVKARRALAAERMLLEEENLRLRHELADRFRPENLIGNSNAMGEVYRALHQVSGSDTTVLIRGESGTGKELVAHAIHYSSPRKDGPFIKVNCAALSEGVLESELFGHEKGAFTGALNSRIGRLEAADGGTLFLDEIGDFSPTTQVKLLRVLQEREFERVGSNETRKANVRIICATNRDLEKLAEEEKFRQDLYYRINVFPILLPPLRERRGDILQLADFFVEKYARKANKDVRRISTPAINMMMAYHWPGNVRELENCIERAVLLATHGVIHGHHLPPTLQTSETSDTFGTGTLAARVGQFEKDIITDALKRNSGRVAAASKDLGTTLRIMRYKIEKLGVDYKRFTKS